MEDKASEKIMERLKAENADLRVCIEQLKCEIANVKEMAEKMRTENAKLAETAERREKELKEIRCTVKVLSGQIEAYQFCVSRGR